MADFETGVAVGMLLAAKSGETPEHDWDYQKWLDLPEPNDNQAVFLIRITNVDVAIGISINRITSPSTYDDSFSVDWGDGNLEMFTSNPESVSHNYTEIGEYIVTFTNILGKNDYAKPSYPNVIMAKYGDKMCADLVKSTGGTTLGNFENFANLRYIRLPKVTEFNARFFSNCQALKTIEFDGAIKNLYTNMFYTCYNLEFDNINFENIINVPTRCFLGCYNLKNIALTDCTTINALSFANCYNLKNVSFPICTSIGNSAFNSDFKLNSFKAASDCTYGTGCFSKCYGLYPKPDGSI